MQNSRRCLAIIGGGATGTAAFIAAIKKRVASKIYVIDPKPPGRGAVFANTDDDILCNTTVATTSIDHDKPLDFLDYLSDIGYGATEDTFAPRRVAGDYIVSRFELYHQKARQSGIDVIHIPRSCTSVKILSHGKYELIFSGGIDIPPLLATDVIFCTGYSPPIIPDSFKSYSECESFISSPYPEDAMLSRLPASSEVLLIGSKLSAIDAALVLCREGHRVTMISPSGELPAVRPNIRIKEYEVDREYLKAMLCLWGRERLNLDERILMRRYFRYFIRTIAELSEVPLKKQFSHASTPAVRLREDIVIAERAECCWQDGIFRWIEAANAIYLQDSDDFKGGLAPYFRHWFGRYLTPVALPNAKKILNYIDGNVMTIEKGSVSAVSLSKNSAAWRVSWGGRVHYFDAVVCASGFHYPKHVIDNSGAIIVSHSGEHNCHAIKIDNNYSIRRLDGGLGESIWFIGATLHERIFATGALFLITAQAKSVIENMATMKFLDI
ncbi:FAD/NAD(P)-binding protein [Burkholderia ubonensis]|uniref:FAD/NAD(P)-binding protein n=1 Tax=Burkholderia ubonensis TaxID=101571 RepID=UPI0009B465E5|nr:FAD/NAD(P)-binding protein [Burkholderia ubonensis]